jgi:hypothetical protein
MKKMRRRRNPLHGWTKLGFVVLLLAVAANSYGQAEDQGTATAGPKSLYLDDLGYHVKGADIPRYHLVEIFLIGVSSQIRSLEEPTIPSQDGFYAQLLAEIGVERGSGAEKALRIAAKRFQGLVYGPNGPIVEISEENEVRRDGTVVPATVVMSFGRGDQGPQFDPSKDDETVQAEVQAYQVEKAKRLADIYYDLILGFERDGVSPAAIERQLYNRIAAHTSLASDAPLNELRPHEKAFENQLLAREAQQLDLEEKDNEH